MKILRMLFLSTVCIILAFSLTGCSAQNTFGPLYDLFVHFYTPESPELEGEIVLYLNSENNKHLSDFVDEGMLTVNVVDHEIVEVEDGVLIPKAKGTTYISCKYENTIKHYSVIVYNGAEFVTSCHISGSTGDSFAAHIGATYQLNTTNSSSCPISELTVDIITGTPTVAADEILTVDENGEIRIVGIGSCEIHVHSATNPTDEGARLTVSSSFADEQLASAVARWMRENEQANESDTITKTQLSKIESLTFTELTESGTSDGFAILPTLKQIIFDLSGGTSFDSTYMIGQDEVSYAFIGNKDTEYGFSISSKKREQLQLHFSDFSLAPRSADAIDLTSVENAHISFAGSCTVAGADAARGGKGYRAIAANDLTLTLHSDTDVAILGGSANTQTSAEETIGGVGVHALGVFQVESNASSYTATLTIRGGGGADGASSGERGENGMAGVIADSLSISGAFTCYLFGGDGGKGSIGIAGEKGSKGLKGNNESEGSHPTYGYKGHPGGNGKPGQKGGDGGNGASALIVMNAPAVEAEVKLFLTAGNGGNGGKGGCGGQGGDGGDGGDDDRFSFIWIGDMSGGSGGEGGQGGDGGPGGLGGTCASPIVINGQDASLNSTNATEINGTPGENGPKGDLGENGQKGSHGYAGAGG